MSHFGADTEHGRPTTTPAEAILRGPVDGSAPGGASGRPTGRTRSIAVAVALAVGLTAGLSPAAPEADAATPKRVVTLTPFLGNAVARIGVRPVATGDTIGSVPRNPLLKGVPQLRLSHPDGPNLEQLLRVKPDLVLSSPNWRTGTSKIKRQKINVIDGYEPVRVNTVSPAVRRVGQVLGRKKQAKKVIASIDRGIKQARAGIRKRPKVLVVLGVGRSTVAFLPNSWGGDIVGYAGGELLTAGLKASFNAGVPGSFATISDEEVLRRDPDVIIVVPHGNPSSIPQIQSFFKSKPGWSPTRAAQKDQIYISDPNTLLQASDDPGAVIRKVRSTYLHN